MGLNQAVQMTEQTKIILRSTYFQTNSERQKRLITTPPPFKSIRLVIYSLVESELILWLDDEHFLDLELSPQPWLDGHLYYNKANV